MGTTLFGISKTTIAGVLAFLITTLTVITAYQIPTNLMNPTADHTWAIVTLVANFALALLRAWVGLVSGDAPTGK